MVVVVVVVVVMVVVVVVMMLLLAVVVVVVWHAWSACGYRGEENWRLLHTFVRPEVAMMFLGRGPETR